MNKNREKQERVTEIVLDYFDRDETLQDAARNSDGSIEDLERIADLVVRRAQQDGLTEGMSQQELTYLHDAAFNEADNYHSEIHQSGPEEVVENREKTAWVQNILNDNNLRQPDEFDTADAYVKYIMDVVRQEAEMQDVPDVKGVVAEAWIWAKVKWGESHGQYEGLE